MDAIIRPFTPDDYPALVAIANANFPDYRTTIDEVRFNDEHRDPRCKHQRWVAEVAGQVVASAEYSQWPGMYHPRRFQVDVSVHPGFQGRGIGSALFGHLLEALRPFDPLSLRISSVREDMPQSLRFAQNRGFREDFRGWESRLDLLTFDPSPYAEIERKVAERGIEITTLADLANDPERDRKLYELETELDRDVPSPEPFTPVPFEHFRERVLGDPNLIPEAYFVARHEEVYVGQSTLWKSQAMPATDLYVGLTGVTRPYRRQGIALALKLRSIAWARARDYRTIRTWNETNNRPMLAINERLGFVKQPAWISFVRTLKDEASEGR